MSEKLMTAKQLADYLNLTVKSVYERVQRHALPFIRIGDSRTVRFKRSDIEKMIEDGSVTMEKRSRG